MYKFRLGNRNHLEISLGCFFERIPIYETVEHVDGFFVSNNYKEPIPKERIINPLNHLESPNISYKEKRDVLNHFRNVIEEVRYQLEIETGRAINSFKLLSSHGSGNQGKFKADFGCIHSDPLFSFLHSDEIDLQDWVEKNDKKFDALAIIACNYPNPVKLKSKHAIIYYPFGLASEDNLLLGVGYKLFIPN